MTATTGTTSYTATFTALYLLTTAVSPTGGGTVSPVSGTYYPSGTVVNLTAASSPGYAFGVWSGNAAIASSASTTVTMSAPQSVTANFYPSSTLLPEWIWEGGSSTGNQSGACGVLLTPALNNLPGGRTVAGNWTDSSGNLWIFGGKGYDSSGTVGDLSDLWKFSPSTGWEWVSGSKAANSAGILSGSGGNPGGREAAVSWADSSGSFWLFGGYGYDVNGTGGFLHDLWKFNSSTGWALISGSSTVGTTTGAGGQLGLYGTLNQFGALNLPGSREYSSGWVDSSGNLWLFGGEAVDSKGNLGYLNDLWEFSPSQGATGEWAWQGGSNVVNRYAASYGTQGTPASTNGPGGRLSASTWTDKSGNFWLFGGEGYDSTGIYGFLNDLWKLVPSPTGGTWTWVSGSENTVGYGGQPGVYGTLGLPAAGNMPGSRLDATTWTDSSGNLWLLGGIGLDVNGNSAPLSDLWEFNPSTSLWTWMGGSNTGGAAGVYGTLQTPATGNMPGSRYFASSWTDNSGTLWLFGGYGKDGNGSYGYLNDLWKFGYFAPPAPTINSGPANPTTATTATFTFSDAQSGVTFHCSLDGAAYAACSSGVSYSTLTIGAHTFAVEAVDSLSNLSTATTYDWTVSATPTVQVTVGTVPTGLSFSVDGTAYIASQTFLWNVGDTHTIATTSTQTSGGIQNTFASWSDGGALSHSVTAPSSTTSYIATFNTSYQLTTAASPSNGGTVTPVSGAYYASGSVVNLSATPNPGYLFSSWTGNVASTSSISTTITMTAPLSVTANFSTASPAVSLTPATLSFGNQTDGTTSASQSVVLKNTGTAPLTITAISLSGANHSNFTENDNCVSASPLAASATCTIMVKFAPSTPGNDTATVSISDNVAGSPQGVSLSGTGTAPPAPIASLTPATLSFIVTTGGTSASQTATLSNTGNAALTIASIAIAGANPSDFVQTNNCASSLAAGSSCSIYVTFTPASAASFSANLTVADNAAGSPQSTLLSGTGTASDYNISSSTPAQSVNAGGIATYAIAVQSVGTFNGSVLLSVTGLPAGAPPPSYPIRSRSALSLATLPSAPVQPALVQLPPSRCRLPAPKSRSRESGGHSSLRCSASSCCCPHAGCVDGIYGCSC